MAQLWQTFFVSVVVGFAFAVVKLRLTSIMIFNDCSRVSVVTVFSGVTDMSLFVPYCWTVCVVCSVDYEDFSHNNIVCLDTMEHFMLQLGVLIYNQNGYNHLIYAVFFLLFFPPLFFDFHYFFYWFIWQNGNSLFVLFFTCTLRVHIWYNRLAKMKYTFVSSFSTFSFTSKTC